MHNKSFLTRLAVGGIAFALLMPMLGSAAMSGALSRYEDPTDAEAYIER